MKQVSKVGAASEAAATMFRAAVADLRSVQDQVRAMRPELCFEDLPAPRSLAPFAAALSAVVRIDGAEIATGRFVLLYDPAGQRGWHGPMRVIVYIRADLEPEIAQDPMVGEVAWSWLTEALDTRTAGYAQPSGTVTRVATEGFGAKRDEPPAAGFELRASWSPVTGDLAAPGDTERPRGGMPDTRAPASTDLGPGGMPDTRAPASTDLGLGGHLAAWCGTLCAAAGLPPLTAGVWPLRPAGRRRSP
jgi:Protein of unknown function (DUF3000)